MNHHWSLHETIKGANITLREFWKHYFLTIVCLKMIGNMGGVNKTTFTSTWNKLWLESIVECDFERFEAVSVKPVVKEIVSLAKILGLKVDSYDIDELWPRPDYRRAYGVT
ncbi:hypothetical protein AVEN_91494-1 [Araneus ventricosus]|uniref:Uncharacterized protein n=1 Tax=Araneus ventricosus TaxID=182803 RepID=A0A4Y2BL79_ARAVE|nr:hypothetical protein AVEN_91494-1 [Araneus ventricosus]